MFKELNGFDFMLTFIYDTIQDERVKDARKILAKVFIDLDDGIYEKEIVLSPLVSTIYKVTKEGANIYLDITKKRKKGFFKYQYTNYYSI